MNLTRCSHGHLYDKDKYDSCPHCQRSGIDRGELTTPLGGGARMGIPTPAGGSSADVIIPLDLAVLAVDTKLNNRYVIQGVLGTGGFGITYLAEDVLLNIKVAIKEFFPQGVVVRRSGSSNEVSISYGTDEEVFLAGKDRFIKEAKVAARFLKSGGIVNVTDYFEANNTAYIVMEYLDGNTLKEYLKTNGVIGIDDVLDLMIPLMESLDEIHQAGLIHRDISPDNIMMIPGGKVKLMDFGAARDYTDGGEKSLSVILKHGYAPVEQYQSHGVQGPWTDIYALSATIYRCITGRVPEDSIERVMDDRLKSPSQLGVKLSPQIEFALMKGLSLAAQDRYQNIRDFCNDLYADDTVTAPVPPVKSPTLSDSEPPRVTPPVSKSLGSKALGFKPSGSTPSGPTPPDDPDSNGPKGFGGKIIFGVLLGVFVVGICLGTVIFFLQQKSQDAIVPDFVNHTLEEAEGLAAEKDSKVVIVQEGEQYSESVEKGHVISQSIQPGTVVKKGAEIGVTISKGQEEKADTGNGNDSGNVDNGDSGDVGKYQDEEDQYDDDYEDDEDENSDSSQSSAMATALKYKDDMEFGPVEYEGHAYGVFNFKHLKLDGFDDCEDFCEDMGGHMAVISSEEENYFLFHFLQDHDKEKDPHTFFGLSDKGHEGKWKWVDGSPVDYTNWCKIKGYEQPNSKNKNEDYAQFFGEVNDGSWNDAKFGDHSWHFLCEWD